MWEHPFADRPGSGRRYLTREIIIKLDGTAGDDSPWYSMRTRQLPQAFTIMITDGYYNGALSRPIIQNVDGGHGFPYAAGTRGPIRHRTCTTMSATLNTTLFGDNSPINPYDDAAAPIQLTFFVDPTPMRVSVWRIRTLNRQIH